MIYLLTPARFTNNTSVFQNHLILQAIVDSFLITFQTRTTEKSEKFITELPEIYRND